MPDVLLIDLLDNGQYQSLLKGEPATCGMRSGRVYLQPGQECGRHSTEEKEELLTFLSGRGQAIIGEKVRYDVGKGKVLYIPPHTIHNIKNTAEEPLIYIYCVAPANQNRQKQNE